MNKRDKARLRQAVSIAINSWMDLIEGYRTEYSHNLPKVNGLCQMCVSKENKPFVESCKRDIKAWKRALERLDIE